MDCQEISEGAYIGKRIINSDNPILRIVNTTDQVKYVKNDRIKLEKLRHFNVFSVNHNDIDKERNEKLRAILVDQIPHDVQNDLMPLCLSYADIFALKDDKMSLNKFYDQKFRMVYSSPVYVKNYRLPQ